MSFWILTYLFFPLIPFFFIMEKWYKLWWVDYWFRINQWHLHDFPQFILTSLSGVGYNNFEITFLDVKFVILFILGICIVSIPLDTFLTNLAIQRNILKRKNEQADCQCRKRRKVKWFTWIYVFWRLLLPDFLIVGPLLAWIFRIQMSPKQILRLNVVIQLIRAGLFIGFACLFKFLYL